MAPASSLPPLRLLVDGVPVAPLAIADGTGPRVRGLLGRRSFAGALLLPGVRSVHSVGMRFALDVARLDGDLRVVRVDRLEPGRLLLPVRGARHSLEAEAGRFAEWRLGPGSIVAMSDPGSWGANRRRIAADDRRRMPDQAGGGPGSPAGST